MRQKHQRLADLFEESGAHFRQHDGESNAQNGAHNDKNDVVDQRVGRKRPGVPRGKEKTKVGEAHKAAAEQTLPHVVIREGIVDPDHGKIIEQQKEGYAGQHH